MVKKLRINFSVLILMCSFISPVKLSNATPTKKAVGKIGMVSGEVLVDGKKVKGAEIIFEKAVVEVQKNSRATLILGKGMVVHLSPESKMVVTEFGVNPESGIESGELDLKFGRTRALLLNVGQKKDVKIKARAATMGVRGTEVYIDAPKEVSAPVQFFTIEGVADLKVADAAPPVALSQNQGMGVSAPEQQAEGQTQGGSGGGSGSSSGGSGSGPATPEGGPVTLSASEVKSAIEQSGLAPVAEGGPIGVPPPPPPGTQAANRGPIAGGLSDNLGMGALPPIVFDPIQDAGRVINVVPVFCNPLNGCP